MRLGPRRTSSTHPQTVSLDRCVIRLRALLKRLSTLTTRLRIHRCVFMHFGLHRSRPRQITPSARAALELPSRLLRKESYAIHIYPAKELVPLDTGISSEAMAIMNSPIDRIFELIATEASHPSSDNMRSVILVREHPMRARGPLLASQLVPRWSASPSAHTRTTLERLSPQLSAFSRPQSTKGAHHLPTTTFFLTALMAALRERPPLEILCRPGPTTLPQMAPSTIRRPRCVPRRKTPSTGCAEVFKQRELKKRGWTLYLARPLHKLCLSRLLFPRSLPSMLTCIFLNPRRRRSMQTLHLQSSSNRAATRAVCIRLAAQRPSTRRSQHLRTSAVSSSAVYLEL